MIILSYKFTHSRRSMMSLILITLISSLFNFICLAQIFTGEPKKLPSGELVFYHWGKEPWMSEMIKEKVYTDERYHFFSHNNGAEGPGLYFADNILTSATYAQTDGNHSFQCRAGGVVEIHLDPTKASFKFYERALGWYYSNSREGISFHPITKNLISDNEVILFLEHLKRMKNYNAFKALLKYFPEKEIELDLFCSNCCCFF
jgi:hypothetical protein